MGLKAGLVVTFCLMQHPIRYVLARLPFGVEVIQTQQRPAAPPLNDENGDLGPLPTIVATVRVGKLIATAEKGMPMKNNRSHRPAGRSGRLAVTLLCTLLSPGFFAPTAMAAEAPASIRTISVSSARPDGVILTYTKILDAPVTQRESNQIWQQMSQQLAQQELPEAGNPFQSFQIACGREAEQNEPKQGKLNLRLQCFPTYAVLNWGFKLASALQATAKDVVSEDGMTYFRNRSFGGKGSPHRVAPDYHFHGTMNPVFVRDHIDFQDTFKWRNDTAGTTVLVVARSANLD